MLKKAFAIMLLVGVAVVTCRQEPPQSPESTPPGTEGAANEEAGPATAIGERPVDVSTNVAPMRMDEVMAGVDKRLAEVGPSHMRSAYMRMNQPQLAEDDQTNAPYFHVEGDENTESLPLKSTSAKVDIAGVIAEVVVTQVYQNRGKKPIEATYVFPGSTRAAVHGMRMTIGERTIVAKIQEREEARANYEAAKEEGKRASLLEQQRANVFTMNVANIMPGDTIKTELLYSELLVPEDGVYNFVYPTVVGPRNPMGANPNSTKWVKNPYLHSGEKEPYAFDIDVHLASPIGLKEVSSPSHKVKVSYASKKSANIDLAEDGGGNRDYVLNYRLAGDHIETGAMLYDHGGEKFFLMMMEPSKRVEQKNIPPREYVFVLDVSGSMHGFPLDTGKELMRNLLRKMRPQDYFNIVVFAGRAGVLHPQSLPATRANLESSLAQIEQMRGGGGTNLMDALVTSYGLPRPMDRAMSRSVVVITDGYVAVEAQAFRFIRQNLGDANLFSFGIGSSVNRGLIEGMARAGMGSPFIVLDQSQAKSRAEKLRKYIESPLLTNIQVNFQGADVYDVVPQAVPDLMAARPLIVFGKYRGTQKGSIQVAGTSGVGKYQQSIALEPSTAQAGNRPLRALWARRWVEELMDQQYALGNDDEVKKAVINLGLGYGLLTQFTSFVAIDSQIANDKGQPLNVKQPLPLPEGVSNYAVAGQAMSLTSASRASSGRKVRSMSGAPRPSGSHSTRRQTRASSRHRTATPTSARPARAAPEAQTRRAPQANMVLRVTSFRNINTQRQAALRIQIPRLFRQCAVVSNLQGVLTIHISADRHIVMPGTSAAFQKCVASTRTMDKLNALLPADFLENVNSQGVIIVRVTP